MSSPPKIVMTLLVRDEADILVHNIEFHRAQGIEHFIITDNLSRDATPSIVAHYVHKGWATSIIERDDDYAQSGWVTRMARMAAAQLDADWVINCDADEFWLASASGRSLKDYFRRIPADADIVLGSRHDFAYLDTATGPWHQQMIYRKLVSLNHIGRPLPPKAAHRANPDILVHQGNHEVSGLDGRTIPGEGLEILHFPIRSKAQFENKIRNGGAAYARNTKVPASVGRGWRNLYHIYVSEGSLDGYLREQCFTPEKVAAALAAGALVIDTRLAEFDFSNTSLTARTSW